MIKATAISTRLVVKEKPQQLIVISVGQGCEGRWSDHVWHISRQ